MSKTHCRFCELNFNGLYLHCPKCGKYLVPEIVGDPQPDIEPENDEYEIVE